MCTGMTSLLSHFGYCHYYCMFQCHGSSGHCWCVDSRGQERAGTRTPPGTPPKDCDRPGEAAVCCHIHPNLWGHTEGLCLSWAGSQNEEDGWWLMMYGGLSQNIVHISERVLGTPENTSAQRDTKEGSSVLVVVFSNEACWGAAGLSVKHYWHVDLIKHSQSAELLWVLGDISQTCSVRFARNNLCVP